MLVFAVIFVVVWVHVKDFSFHVQHHGQSSMSLKLESDMILLTFSNITWSDYKDWTEGGNDKIWEDIREPMQ